MCSKVKSRPQENLSRYLNGPASVYPAVCGKQREAQSKYNDTSDETSIAALELAVVWIL